MRVLYLLAAVALLAAAFLAWPRGPKEPVYQGKPFTQWITLKTPRSTINPPLRLASAAKAVAADSVARSSWTKLQVNPNVA